jgi:hypothetical protein
MATGTCELRTQMVAKSVLATLWAQRVIEAVTNRQAIVSVSDM